MTEPQAPSAGDRILGNRSLARFDVCIIGSGAGGSAVAHVLTAAGKNVLVLETGPNPFPGLDEPGDTIPPPHHANDELRYVVRRWLFPDPLLEPRTFRTDPGSEAVPFDDVNVLPHAVGGAFQLAGACASPRFHAVDFRLASAVEELRATNPGLVVPGFGDDVRGASFVDWPFSYDDLEPFYVEAENLHGVQGATDNPFASRRSQPYPMAPGVPMYANLLLADAARSTAFLDGHLTPHVYPLAVNSRPRDGRPACVDCGACSGYGCPSHAKGSPPVTTLRRALLSGRCQLRYECHVTRLVSAAGRVSAVEYVDGEGAARSAIADAFVLAASAIESARICLLSDPGGPGLGNGSGLVGRNLMFHSFLSVNGFMAQRVHGERGRTNTHGLSDLRGVEPGGEALRVVRVDGEPRVFVGGLCEFTCSQGSVIHDDGYVYTQQLPGPLGARRGAALASALRDLPLGQHLVGVDMVGEDAPQLENRVDLDPRFRDIWGQPAARVTYRAHAFERQARAFYEPVLRSLLANAGARELYSLARPTRSFVTPCQPALVGPPVSRHVLGTLRMGNDPATSVVAATGRFHEVENLYAADGSVFPTSGGANPTITIIAVALRIAHGMAAG